jgi:CPA1 family monovalent cation:H+ antiporter
MILFESILLMLLGAVLLSALAGRIGIPSPVVLAIGGTALAFIPNAPQIALDPELVLALFVAPILLDSAFDTSPRDLRANWLPVGGLVFVAVGATTATVAFVSRWFFPDLPLAAAIALGAIVAPPDAVAATAILRRLRPPHRIVVILEGESLLNDATALLIYRLAVAAVVTGGFTPSHILPTFVVVLCGSLFLGAGLAWLGIRFLGLFQDRASAIILQFVTTFGVWILAERLHLSGIITIVTYGMVIARYAPARTSASLRIPAYAVWETIVFVLQILAFVLVGLQLRPIVEGLPTASRVEYAACATAVLVSVILVRVLWVMSYNAFARRLHASGLSSRESALFAPTIGGGLVISWCGMRGIVTLAAAYALPADFPYRDLILLCSFTVVVGTLVIQGLTLGPLLRRLTLGQDGQIEREYALLRKVGLEAAVAAVSSASAAVAEAIRGEYRDMAAGHADGTAQDTERNALRRKALAAARTVALDMRRRGVVGDDAFHRFEEELDWLELGAAPREAA